MSVLVNGTGAVADEWAGAEFLPLSAFGGDAPLPEAGLAVQLAAADPPETLLPWFDRIAVIRVEFPAMGDGRGFSLAHRLRSLGYSGRLRAAGPLVTDQLRAALRVGFDEVEVADAVADRQPSEQWRVREQGSYQKRLLG